MSLGSCLVTNEMSGQAEAFIQARIDGKSWADIATEFGLPNPGAARKAFLKATGINDFKIKGQALADLVKQGPDALKAVNQVKVAAKKVKALDDVVQKKPPVDGLDLSKHKLEWPEAETPSIKTKFHTKYGFTDKDYDKIHELWINGKATLDIIDEYPQMTMVDVKSLFKFFDEENTAKKLAEAAAQKAMDAASGIQKPFTYNKISDNVLEALDEDKLKELRQVLIKQKVDDLEQLEDAKKYAQENFKTAQKKYHPDSDQYFDAKEEYEYTLTQLNEYLDNVLPKLDADIVKVEKLLGKKPVTSIPDTPDNTPVKGKWLENDEVAKNTGLTLDQVEEIIEMNGSGHGYLYIKNTLGVEFPQIDAVVWNNLLEKHNGFTWKAYLEKPTSESGYNAVKAKVFEARSKGLSITETAAKPGAPPEGVINAILKDKWKLPEAGSKIPHVPPPPPPPPQTFGGVIPSQTGINFKRYNDPHMLRWIEPDTAGLDAHHRKAITNYTNSGYVDINKYLRGLGLTDDHGYGYNSSNVVQLVKSLDETMRPLPHDITLTRNFSGVHHLPAEPEDMVGVVYHDDAFMSTTIKSEGVFSGDVQLIINAPKGTMGRYVQDISHHKSEQEVLLARGTKMVVTKVEKHGSGYSTRWRLFCDVIAG